MNKTKGIIFNIQRFSVHDGPGIRTVVFEKGCPLRCKWCANPESQNHKPELAWTKTKCIGCGQCTSADLSCNPYFFEENLCWDDFESSESGIIERTCPSKALHVIGYETTVEQVIEQIDRDQIFYGDEEGGLTISGGEPLMQYEFTYELLKEAKAQGINTTIETTGFGNPANFVKIAGELDYLLMDIKTMDPVVHRNCTGVSNELIISNLDLIREIYPNLPIQIRTPVIPGVNYSEESISAIASHLKKYNNIAYELLKYHRLGESKYQSLHRMYPMGEVSLSDEKYQALKKYEFNNILGQLYDRDFQKGAGI